MRREIWQVLDSRKPGGIETHVLHLSIGLKQQGYNVKVVFLTNFGEHPLKHQLEKLDVPYQCLDGRLSTVIKAMQKAKPAVVHTHGYKAGLIGRLAAKCSGIRAFSTYHAGEKAVGKMACYDFLDRYTAWLAYNSFAVSDEISRRIPTNTNVLNNFIETRNLSASHGKQVAFVGRLSEEKGADRFMDLARAFPEKIFHIYGDGPLGEVLRSTAPKNVIFHGQRDDMDEVWSSIGLLIVPSRYEGLPLAVLESMGRNIPVIATAVGALPNVIEDGINGWLIEPSKTQQLKEILAKWFYSNPCYRHQVGHAAKRTIQANYSSKVVVPQLIAYYNI